jgi:uncharacterized membrane protein YeiH
MLDMMMHMNWTIVAVIAFALGGALHEANKAFDAFFGR